jgi:hypothetical protein
MTPQTIQRGSSFRQMARRGASDAGNGMQGLVLFKVRLD